MCIGRVCIVRVLCVMAGLTGPVCIGRVCIVRVLCVVAGVACSRSMVEVGFYRNFVVGDGWNVAGG